MVRKLNVGDIVFVKGKGFSYWPGRIASKAVEDELKEFRNQEGIAILFLGDELLYDLASEKDIKEFKMASEHVNYKGKRSHVKDFKIALELAQNNAQIEDPLLELDEAERKVKKPKYKSVSTSVEAEEQAKNDIKNDDSIARSVVEVNNAANKKITVIEAKVRKNNTEANKETISANENKTAEKTEKSKVNEKSEKCKVNEETEKSNPIEENKVNEESKLFEQAKPMEQTKAVEEAKIIKETESVEPIEETRSGEEAKIIEETKPTEEAKIIEEVRPVEVIEAKVIKNKKDTKAANAINENSNEANNKVVVEDKKVKKSVKATFQKSEEVEEKTPGEIVMQDVEEPAKTEIKDEEAKQEESKLVAEEPSK